MWRPYLFIVLLLGSSLSAQDRFAAVGEDVFRISPDNTFVRILKVEPRFSDLRYGSTDPRISPDQRWIAYVKDRNAWLRPTGEGRAIQLTTVGKKSAGRYLSVEVFVVGFTADSKELMYSVAPGKNGCPDCARPAPVRQTADYGFFLQPWRPARKQTASRGEHSCTRHPDA